MRALTRTRPHTTTAIAGRRSFERDGERDSARGRSPRIDRERDGERDSTRGRSPRIDRDHERDSTKARSPRLDRDPARRRHVQLIAEGVVAGYVHGLAALSRAGTGYAA